MYGHGHCVGPLAAKRRRWKATDPMPKITPETQTARRERILDAAELCFARSGFHRTTMQHICREAGVSPGALYIYFDSKEALIAGLCQRDRARLGEDIERVAAAPDLMQALASLATHYAMEEPRHKRVLHVEIGAEATRNREIAALVLDVDRHVRGLFTAMLEGARREGRIAPVVPEVVVAQVLCLIGDGLFWRRAVDPDFDASTVMPALMSMVASLLGPQSTAATAEKQEAGEQGGTRGRPASGEQP
jgi:TetR/AcrR family transcriptional repressor of uid operon